MTSATGELTGSLLRAEHKYTFNSHNPIFSCTQLHMIYTKGRFNSSQPPNMSKTVAIIGATGHQGSSVAETFLNLPNWHVRCLTRRPDAKKTQHLASLGAEVIEADLDNVDSLIRAFQNVHAIFLNTDFWQPYSSCIAAGGDRDASSRIGFDTEMRHAVNTAVAASEIETLERFVYSALGPIKAVSGGKYHHSYHWDSKAEAVSHIKREFPQLASKTSFIYLGAYSTNPLLYPKLNSQTGKYEMILPASQTTRFPIIDVNNSTGLFVRALVEDEDANVSLLAYDSYLSLGEIFQAWKDATKTDAEYVEVTIQKMHEITGVPLEVLDAPGYVAEFGYMAGIENVMEPADLKNRVVTPSYQEFLAKQDVKVSLRAQIPEF